VEVNVNKNDQMERGIWPMPSEVTRLLYIYICIFISPYRGSI